MFNKLSKKTKVLALAVGLVVVVALGAFAYWTISPLFINVRVSEALPDQGQAASQPVSQGTFVDADGFHKAQGAVKVVRADEGLVVRFEEDFQVTNGPDLYVWLVKDGDVRNGYVDLGRLKGNLGSQNYEVPADTDLSQYDSVFIWCKAFSVLFGSAQLQ